MNRGGRSHVDRWRIGLCRHTLSVAIVALAAMAPRASHAQGYRGWIGSSIQTVEFRPLGLDTVPRAEVELTEVGALLYQGRPAACFSSEFCSIYRALDQSRSLAMTQDVSVTAWGFGLQGLSVTTLLRGRFRVGDDVIWPRSDDEFDAMLAYAQWVHGQARVRLGRQELRTGLGFAAFDGAWSSYDFDQVQMEAYAGRSLARGLREPANEALRGVEDFVPDESAYLFGAAGRAQISGTSVTTRYHREILADRSGLVSERGSIDFSSILPRVHLSGSLDYDFGFGRLGKGHLSASVPLRDARWLIDLSLRRYVPYFELSTIWGFFEPVAYSEVVGRASWSPRASVGLWASGGWRSYEEAGATVVLRPLDDTGWKVDVGGNWAPDPAWAVDAEYRLEWNPGGFLNSADASVRHTATETLSLSASASSFQQIEEFRIGDGRAFGLGLSFDWAFMERARWSGGLSFLRHRQNPEVESPWNQERGWLALRVEIGEDPGLANRRNR